MRKLVAGISLVIAIVAPGMAGAAPMELTTVAQAQDDNRWRVGFDAGLASAVGLGGFTLSYAPTERLVVEAGVGGGPTGLQLSVMPKLAWGTRHRYVLGVGPSVALGLGSSFNDGTIVWLNADLLGYEFRSNSGWSFFAAAGTTTILSGEIESFIPEFPDGDPGERQGTGRGATVPQVRIGVGYWF